jgi:uncharacterized membrane protein YdjX (TVP38/TMEM64 family)
LKFLTQEFSRKAMEVAAGLPNVSAIDFARAWSVGSANCHVFYHHTFTHTCIPGSISYTAAYKDAMASGQQVAASTLGLWFPWTTVSEELCKFKSNEGHGE